MLEVIIAAALLIIVLSMAAQLFLPAVRYMTRQSGRADLERQAMVVCSRVAADAVVATSSTINFHNSNGVDDAMVLGLEPLAGMDVQGNQSWSQQLIAYIWQPATHCLLRRVWQPGGTPALTLQLTPMNPTWPADQTLVDLGRVASVSGDVVLAQNVVEADLTMTATSSPSPQMTATGLSFPLTLHLKLQSPVDATDTFEIRRQFSPRNATNVAPAVSPTPAASP